MQWAFLAHGLTVRSYLTPSEEKTCALGTKTLVSLIGGIGESQRFFHEVAESRT